MLLALAAGAPAQGPATPPPPSAGPADPGRGLWIGPIHICRDTAEGAVADALYDGAMPSLTITLKPALHATLRAETERRLGATMPIRLDGQLISEPRVYEPITRGGLSLTNLSDEETRTVQAAVGAAC